MPIFYLIVFTYFWGFNIQWTGSGCEGRSGSCRVLFLFCFGYYSFFVRGAGWSPEGSKTEPGTQWEREAEAWEGMKPILEQDGVRGPGVRRQTKSPAWVRVLRIWQTSRWWTGWHKAPTVKLHFSEGSFLKHITQTLSHGRRKGKANLVNWSMKAGVGRPPGVVPLVTPGGAPLYNPNYVTFLISVLSTCGKEEHFSFPMVIFSTD